MSQDKIERVARAIRPNLFAMYPNGKSQAHEEARNMARAAIEALTSTEAPIQDEVERALDDAVASVPAPTVGTNFYDYARKVARAAITGLESSNEKGR